MNKYCKALFLICIIGISISLAASIFTHGYIGSFSRYIADDYCTASSVNNEGYIQAVIGRYLTWDGRYSFILLISALELMGEKIVPFMPFVSIFVLCISCFFFLRQMLRLVFQNISSEIVVLLCLSSIFLIVFTIFNPGQDLYWLTGIITYLFPIIFEFLTIGFFFYLFSFDQNLKDKLRILNSCLLFCLSFLTCGFSEVSTTIHLVIAIILFTIIVYKAVRQKKTTTRILYGSVLLAGAILGFIFMVAAPGNAVRAQSYPSHPIFSILITQSLKLSVKFIFNKWFMYNSIIIWPTFILLFMLGIYLSVSSKIQTAISNKTLGKILLITVITAAVLVFVSFIPSYWAMSKRPPERVLLLPSAILSLCLVITSSLLGLIIGKYVIANRQSFLLILGTFLIIGAYYIVSVPYIQARDLLKSSLKPAIEFANQWDLRQNEIIDQKQAGEKHIKTFMIADNLVELEHLKTDPAYWINRCAADYYQVETLSVN